VEETICSSGDELRGLCMDPCYADRSVNRIQKKFKFLYANLLSKERTLLIASLVTYTSVRCGKETRSSVIRPSLFAPDIRVLYTQAPTVLV
jgi:hypothetical protein